MENKAGQLRAEAQENFSRARESFERCDTDGFLSQWANNLSGWLKETQADIEDAGGVAEFFDLFEEETGRRVNAIVVDGKFGRVWLLGSEEEHTFGRRFIPTDDSHMSEEDVRETKARGLRVTRSKVQVGLGLVQKKVMALAKARIANGGVQVVRTDTWGWER